MRERNEVVGGALWALFCCTVMACTEPSVVAGPSAGSGGSGVSGSSGSAGSSSGGGGAGAVAGSSGGGSTDPRDASADAADAADARSFCCTPSPQPDCCMVYGGRSLDCPVVCDNMPLPGAAWQLGVDSYGCPVWIEPPRTNECCGCPLVDAGL